MEYLRNLFEVTKDELTCPEDALVLYMHCVALSMNMHLVGIGAEWSSQCERIESGRLPEGWNSNRSHYRIRYVDRYEDRYLLHVSNNESCKYLFVSWTDPNTENVYVNTFVTEEFAGDCWKEYLLAYNENMKSFEEKMKMVIRTGVRNKRDKDFAKERAAAIAENDVTTSKKEKKVLKEIFPNE